MMTPTFNVKAADDELSHGLHVLSSGLEAGGALLEDYALEHDKAGDDESQFHFHVSGLVKLFGTFATRLYRLHTDTRLAQSQEERKPTKRARKGKRQQKGGA
jgi:hypothetical protein